MRILSESDDVIGPELIASIVVLSLILLFYFAVSCIVRCFYPDMTKGPEWFVNPRNGNLRWLRPPRCGDFFCCCLVKDLVQEENTSQSTNVDDTKTYIDKDVPRATLALDSLFKLNNKV